MSMIGELAALGAAICWAVSAILYRKALQRVKPISANIARLVGTTIFVIVSLAVVSKLGILTSLPTYALLLATASGIIGLGLGDTLYMFSLKSVGVARAVPLTCTYPLFSLLLAVFLQGEVVNLQVILGAVTIVLGIWLLGRESETETDAVQKRTIAVGIVAALVTAVIWAISIAMINVAVTLPETGSMDSALAINAIRILSIAFFLLASAPVTDRGLGFLRMQRKNLAAFVVGGIIALALGWFLLTFSFLRTPQSIAVPISSTTPLFATISGILLLHERVTVRAFLGSVVIVAGIFLLFLVRT
jgi:DME family drug/metabolite transporter